MSVKTAQEYRESLAKRKPLKVYWNGGKLEDPIQHPIVKSSVNSVALTYELAHDPQHQHLLREKSSLTGDTINRFCHLHQSTDDLLKKIQMQRLLGQKCGTCFQRCVGMDAMNAVFSITFLIDKKHNTDYHQRFKKYVQKAQDEDLVIDGCMTDPKGDRSKRPSEQKDPDLYVHVVERREDGVVIRGAKAHQTGAINSHYHLIMPTTAMREGDEEYAVCCSVAADHPGITYIYGRQSCDLRKLDESKAGDIDSGNPCFGGQECLVVFDNVFVPNEDIFMDGEIEFTGSLVESFAGYHRQSYCCKTGVGDVMIGAAACMAQYNGTTKASHIKDKIVEMNLMNETIYSCGVAAAVLGKKTEAGNYLIDLLSANICKQHVTRYPYEIARLLQDIAGGLMVTLPSAKDFDNAETKSLLEKYLVGAEGVDIFDRVKMLRLIENLTLGRAAVGYLTESLHGAGSPQAQRIMISRLVNLKEKMDMAKNLVQ
ncbi:4-hydroxybutanoyl-CoA dehydratase / Vinylacetyl-CoA Delta-isomerase [hydrothermal vent metagenome]|uniref:4-hydroxybutanoyl-CoA dehydratase / Vinylacetyl-CoA Delta-isomerase n=1 Tax=hydrothermal vent metagenome TaxID=652676 RepID=A0A3B1D8V1_9ZZZZ